MYLEVTDLEGLIGGNQAPGIDMVKYAQYQDCTKEGTRERVTSQKSIDGQYCPAHPRLSTLIHIYLSPIHASRPLGH